MKPEYFIVRMYYDRSGKVVPGSEEIVQYLEDQEVIYQAEASHASRKSMGKGAREHMIEEGARGRRRKSDRPTIPEVPMALLLANQDDDWDKVVNN